MKKREIILLYIFYFEVTFIYGAKLGLELLKKVESKFCNDYELCVGDEESHLLGISSTRYEEFCPPNAGPRCP